MTLESLKEGDIVEFSARQAGLARRSGRDTSYGYIHHRIFDGQDRLEGFSVFEVIPAQNAQEADRRYHVVNRDDAGNGFGLHADKTWAIVIDPVFLRADEKSFGRRDGLAQRIGNIADTPEESKLKELVGHIGEDKIYFSRGDGPSFAQTRPDLWGVYAPIGVTRNVFDDDQFKPVEKTGKSRVRRSKNDKEGYVVDLSFADAVERLNISADIAALFASPKGKVKALSGLRDLRDLVYDRPADIDKYLPKEKRLTDDINLGQLENDLHPAVLNGLREPRDPAATPVIETLNDAFELVSKRPEDLRLYKYLGPANQKVAIEEITALYQKNAVKTVAAQYDRTEIIRQVKTAWDALATAYRTHQPDQKTAGILTDDAGKPLWFKRALKP